MTPTGAVFTIGHSTHPLGEFVGLLRRHRVEVVVDVRSAPYSRFNPQFNREPLAAGLEARRFEYLFLGRELGGRSDDPADRDPAGRLDYRRVRGTDRFRRGIEEVLRRAAGQRLALLCAEKDPRQCHRTRLVEPALEARNLAVRHILANGELLPHARAVQRLLF